MLVLRPDWLWLTGHFPSLLQNWAGMRCPYKLLRMILALVCSKFSRVTIKGLCSSGVLLESVPNPLSYVAVEVLSLTKHLRSVHSPPLWNALMSKHLFTVSSNHKLIIIWVGFISLLKMSRGLATRVIIFNGLEWSSLAITHVALFSKDLSHSAWPFSPHGGQFAMTFISEQYCPSIYPVSHSPVLKTRLVCPRTVDQGDFETFFQRTQFF